MTSKLTLHVLHFIVYAALQILLMQNLILFNKAFSFIYIAFLLLLPFDMDRIIQMILGFSIGLVIDIFYDSLGIHIAACVLLMYIRPYWLNVVLGKDTGDNINIPVLRNMGFERFTLYILPLIFVHHAALFYIEAGGFQMFFFTLVKTLLSTLLTYIFIVIFQYLFYPKRRTI